MLVCGVEMDMEALYQKHKNEKVKAIGEVRRLSGAGLKEAKEAVDAFWAQKDGTLRENRESIAQNGEQKDSSAKKKRGFREIASWITSILVLIILFKMFTGDFDQLASDLTNGAYGKGSKADKKTATATNDVVVEQKNVPVEETGVVQQDGVADGYKKMPIQAPTNQIINDYHEKGYGAVWLTSHDVRKNDGEIGDIGTTDSVNMQVTYFDPNGYYQVTEEISALYVWWGEEIGWQNNYDVGTLLNCDNTGFNGTHWKLVSDKEMGYEDYNYNKAASLIGNDIMSQYDIHSRVTIYFAFENFDILNAGIEEAIHYNKIYLNAQNEVGTANVVVNGSVYSMPLKLEGATESNLLIDKGAVFAFDGTGKYDKCYVAYSVTGDSDMIPISTEEYESALQGLARKIAISGVDARESVDMSDVDVGKSIDTPDVDVQENDSLDFVFPYSDSMYLELSDLQGLSAEECRIARNEIYARHGRIFQDTDLQSFFEQFDWYEGLYTADEFDESVLNKYEKANRDLIVKYESEMGF